jgi:nucleotide-binding universal stress UspA family protein
MRDAADRNATGNFQPMMSNVVAGMRLKEGVEQMENFVESSNLRDVDARQFQPQLVARDAGTIRRILVCIDRSAFSEGCLGQAVAIAKGFGSAITLVHVMQPPHERSGPQTTNVFDWEIARQEATAYLERLQKEGTEASGGQVEYRLEQGHPAERITEVARELGADLTVLGSQGERGVAAWNLGSTVQQVLAVARGSVLIARPGPAGAIDGAPKRILVPLDGSLRAESVLPTAVRIASAHDAEMLLAFVVREQVATAVLRAPEDLQTARRLAARLEIGGEVYLNGLRDQLLREGASVRTLVVRSTDERRSILDLSRTERSDLIVLSAHGSTCNPALTCGSVTAHLIAHSVVSLLVLQDLRRSELGGQATDGRAPPLCAHCQETV